MASSKEFLLLVKKVLLLNELQKDTFNDEKKEENNFLNLFAKSLDHINHNETILYPKELVRLINKIFNFEYDQQDSYELYHRILDILDNFLVKYKFQQNENENFKEGILFYIKRVSI